MKIKSFIAGILIGGAATYYFMTKNASENEIIQKNNSNYLLNNKTKTEIKIGEDYVGDINYLLSSLEKATIKEMVPDSLVQRMEKLRYDFTKKSLQNFSAKNGFAIPSGFEIAYELSINDSTLELFFVDEKTKEKIPIKDYGNGLNIGTFDQKSRWINDEAQQKSRQLYKETSQKISDKFQEIQDNLSQFYDKIKETISK